MSDVWSGGGAKNKPEDASARPTTSSADTPTRPRFVRSHSPRFRRQWLPANAAADDLRPSVPSGRFVDEVVRALRNSVPGGVRVASEHWLQYGAPWRSDRSFSSPDVLLLDDVWVRVHYPRIDDPTRPLPPRCTQLVPMRWIEGKNTYGNFTHFYTTPAGAPRSPLQSPPRSYPSPSRAAIVEQASRYALLFGPGCVAFREGFSDAWLRPQETPQGEQVAMPPDVCFLDFAAIQHAQRIETNTAPHKS